jgi:hypothetical protein
MTVYAREGLLVVARSVDSRVVFASPTGSRFRVFEPRRFGLGLDIPHTTANQSGSTIVVPLLLPLLLALVPALILTTLIRRRKPPGHCPYCGYNLTGNQSGVCSECGTPIVKPAKAG